MDFKSLLSQLDQLNEAKEKTKTGLKHTAEPGGYGRKDDEDDEGHKVKSTAVKKGKGRPKKDADDSGETKKYDFSAFGVKSGKDVKLPKHDKKKTTVVKGKSQSHASNKVDDGTDPGEEPKTKKKGLKEYFDSLDKALNEAEQIQIKPASQMPKQPGQTSMQKPGQPQQVAGQPQKNTQVIQQGDKVLGTVDNQNLANQIKQSIGKGEMTLMPDQQVNELDAGTVASYQDKAFDKFMGGDDKRAQGLDRASKKQAGAFGHVPTTQKVNEKDIGKHNNATTGFDALVRKLTPKYGAEAAKRIAGKQAQKIKEADQPPNDSLLSPMSEARAKAETAGKKVTKDLPGNQDKLDVAEPKGKLDAKDFKELSKKKKVKEGMEHKLKAARHTGKAHALSKQAYNCNYDDMEESRHYHEGFKEGLDECYGQMPIQGYVGEANNEVADMASYGAHTPTMEDDMYEMDKTSYMKQQAIKTPGNTFKAFGQTFKDKEVVESPFAFEAWEKELNSILEGKEVTEGMTVSISKGQQGTPDSVSVSAQDAEADQLLGIIKSAGLGLFGGDDAGHSHTGQPMTVDVDGGEGPQANIEVVDDHDDMLSLIRKMTGQGPAQSNGDYEEEGGEEMHGHEHGHEETCESCGGMMEEGHSCGEAVEENETIPQAEEEVAEEINPNNNDEAEEEQTDATRDAALATAAGKNFADTDAPLEEGGDGGEASDAGNIGVEAGDAEEEMQASMNEEDEDEKQKDGLEESSFANLYRKLAMLSEESTSEKDDKAEKAAKKVAKDIEYDEDHKGKDDDKAEEAGKKVKKDIEYDDKKDKKEKKEKIDEWANDAGPGKSASDTSFETDMDFMMNVISGGLNKRKSTGQTTIPVIANQVNRTVSNGMTGINESVSDWKKLAGLK